MEEGDDEEKEVKMTMAEVIMTRMISIKGKLETMIRKKVKKDIEEDDECEVGDE